MAKQASGNYWAQISCIPAKKCDDTYYVAAIYSTGGETRCSGVTAYSLSKYFISRSNNGGSMKDLAEAAAMYGYYAKAYFTN
jgi:hypothetical protein